MNRRTFVKTSVLVPASATGLAVSLTQDPMDELQDLAKDAPRLPNEEFQRRIDKARELMGRQRIDAFCIEGGSSLEYFCGIRWGRSERMFALVIPQKGRMAVVCPAFEKGRALEQVGSFPADVLTWEEHESPFALTAKLLAERGIRTGKIGVEPSFRFFLADGLGKESPALEVVNGRAISDGCRMAKSPIELQLMQLASEITKKAFHAALAGLKEGMKPAELNSRIGDAHRRMGTSGGALVLFGPASAFPHGTEEVRGLQEGDVVLIDGGCKIRGYSSDVTRTTVFGEPSTRQLEIWQIVREAQEKALQKAGPGLPCEEVDRTAREVIEKAGFGPGYKYFTHRLGHGIGMDGHEEPYLVKGNRLILKPGMTFSDEPGIYIPGEFGVRHEDVMVITDSGARFLGEKTRSIKDPV